MKRPVVFTDLDGTLLDHDTYDWQPAAAAVDALRLRGIPLVLVSSKTLAELAGIRRDLGIADPVVAENGCCIEVPDDYFEVTVAPPAGAVSRDSLQQEFVDMRSAGNFTCTAFYEMGTDGIAAATGLTPAAAERANRRAASEPILWQDSANRLAEFRKLAAARGLRAVQGGRFVHLMGQADKADAMRTLMHGFRRRWHADEVICVALGDGPNDLDMLHAADIAVVIQGRHDHPMPLSRHSHVLRPRLAGPAGWSQAITHVLELYPVN